MRAFSPDCHDPLLRRPDDGIVRVSVLWLIGAAALFVVCGAGWNAVASPAPPPRILGSAVLVPVSQEGGAPVGPGGQGAPDDDGDDSGSLGDTGDTGDTGDEDGWPTGAGSAAPVGGAPGAGGDAGSATAGGGAGEDSSATGSGLVDGPSVLGQPVSSSRTVVSLTGAPASSSVRASAPGSSSGGTTATRPTSAPTTTSAPSTSTTTTSAPRTVTVTRVRTLGDDHEDDGKEKDHSSNDD